MSLLEPPLFVTEHSLSKEANVVLESSKAQPLDELATSIPTSRLSHLDGAKRRICGGEPSTHMESSFIRLLEHAQLRQVPILPLTWEPALERPGLDGATSTVNQSLLNSQISLAFKRFTEPSDAWKLHESEFRAQQYEAMITELTISGVPALQTHPNIIETLGICFELVRNSDEIRPVLVLRRAEGDLAGRFFESHYPDLSDEVLISICGEVAKGLRALHQNNIVHGDIKPNNILIGQNEEGSANFSVALTDFGFSRFGISDQDLVQLTRSQPWEAPEWSHGYVQLIEAKKQDIYSFTLFCLWLFFKNKSLETKGFGAISLHDAIAGHNMAAFDEIQHLKRTGNGLVNIAQQLITENSSYNAQTKSLLERLFLLGLQESADSRCDNIETIVSLLCGEEIIRDNEITFDAHNFDSVDLHGTLQMDRLFFDLESCDYRVHTHLAKALANVAAGAGCGVCKQNAAFQLVFCHAIGFGVAHDPSDIAEYLAQSGKTEAQVNEVLQGVRNDNKTSDIVMAQLVRQGMRNSFGSRYRSDGVLSDAIDYYYRMAAAQHASFGPGHFSLLRIQGALFQLLMSNSRLQEAMEVASAMDQNMSHLGVTDRIEIKSNLAWLHTNLQNLEEAEDLLKEILQLYEEGEQTTERQDSRRMLVKVFIEQGKFEEAISLANDILRYSVDYLGEMHGTTIGVRRTLADAYIGKGQLELAVEPCRQLLKTQERLANETDLAPSLIQDTCMYGIICYRLNDFQTAKQCYEKVSRYIKLDHRMAKYAIVEIDRNASSLAKIGDYDAAVEIREALLAEAKNVVGGDTQDIALVMGNLAAAYHHQNRFAEAEKLERRVVQIRRTVLGQFHADTITGLANLRASLIEQGKFEEAASMGEEELYAYAGSRDATPVLIANATAVVADALEAHEAYQSALHVTEVGRQLTQADSNEAHSTCLRILARSARYRLHLGDISRADETTTILLHQVTRLSGLNIDGLLSQLIPLANKYLELERFTASEQTLVLSCLLSRGDPDLPEKLKTDLMSLMRRYLEARGLDHFDARFDPDALSSRTES